MCRGCVPAHLVDYYSTQQIHLGCLPFLCESSKDLIWKSKSKSLYFDIECTKHLCLCMLVLLMSGLKAYKPNWWTETQAGRGLEEQRAASCAPEEEAVPAACSGDAAAHVLTQSTSSAQGYLSGWVHPFPATRAGTEALRGFWSMRKQTGAWQGHEWAWAQLSVARSCRYADILYWISLCVSFSFYSFPIFDTSLTSCRALLCQPLFNSESIYLSNPIALFQQSSLLSHRQQITRSPLQHLFFPHIKNAFMLFFSFSLHCIFWKSPSDHTWVLPPLPRAGITLQLSPSHWRCVLWFELLQSSGMFGIQAFGLSASRCLVSTSGSWQKLFAGWEARSAGWTLQRIKEKESQQFHR